MKNDTVPTIRGVSISGKTVTFEGVDPEAIQALLKVFDNGPISIVEHEDGSVTCIPIKKDV